MLGHVCVAVLGRQLPHGRLFSASHIGVHRSTLMVCYTKVQDKYGHPIGSQQGLRRIRITRGLCMLHVRHTAFAHAVDLSQISAGTTLEPLLGAC
jgi:hypothetical protein